MSSASQAPDEKRNNNFGFLRLLFAALVIVSHSPELLDGNRSREIFTRLFDSPMTFGGVGVYGFFLISGYLITKSYLNSPSIGIYLKRRVLRIVPGYFVCFWICALVVAPLAGAGAGAFDLKVVAHNLGLMVRLYQPEVPGAFHGLAYKGLNGAMWTLAYEFRCYLLIILLGLAGLFRGNRRWVIVGITLCGLIAIAAQVAVGTDSPAATIIGLYDRDISFTTTFMVGSLFHLFRAQVPLNFRACMVAIPILIGGLLVYHLADVALILFGGYILFYVALRCPVLSLSRADNNADISYGVYLYGWPVINLLIFYTHDIGPWILCLCSLLLAGILGYLSWIFVERPWLKTSRTRLPKTYGQEAGLRT